MTTLGWGETRDKPPSAGIKEVDRLKLGDETRIRIVGPLLPRFTYWLTNKEGKRRTVETLSFDRKKEMFTGARDPIAELPEATFSEKPSFAYVCNVIDRKDGRIKLFELKKKIYESIIALAKNKEYGDPSHPLNGYDLTIKKTKTGPSPMNVTYSTTPSRNTTPLTDEERALELYDLEALHKVPTYEEQVNWLIENTFLLGDVSGSTELEETLEDL